MTVTTTILTALLAVQAGAPNQEPAARDASAVTPRIEIPEETTDTTTQPIAESTWQNTEIELLVQKARESLQEDRYPEALDLYIAASDRRPLDERLQYNLGVAAYRAGALDVATRAFERASAGDDPKITQSALFNRGNVSYRRALDLVEDARDTQSRERASEGQADPQTLEQPIDALKQALSHYRDAIIASPDSRDARRNAELAHRLMKALEETQEEQQQEQDQQEQDQQEQDQQEQDQQEQDQQNQDQQEQDQQEQDQQEQDQQEQDQQEQDQQNQDQQNQDQQNQDQQNQDQQNQDQQNQDQQEQDQQEQDQQEQDQQEQDQQEQDQQEQDQQEQDQQEQDQQEQDQQEQDQQNQDQQEPKESDAKSGEDSANKEAAPVRMTREQAEALLQMIRDKEKERREVLAAREAREAARKKTPVEKDW